MDKENRSNHFDRWVKCYESSIRSTEGFSFSGYEQVLEEVARIANTRARMTILDLGIGTGDLAARFSALGCTVWGIDFSTEMLSRVRLAEKAKWKKITMDGRKANKDKW